MLPRVAQAMEQSQQTVHVARVQTDRRLVEHVQRVDELRAAVNFIGHGVPEITAAMAAQAKQLEFVHTSQFTTPIAEQYAQELLSFAGKISKVEQSISPAVAQKRLKPR